MDSLHHVPPLPTIPPLTRARLEALLVELYGEAVTLEQTVAEQREEIARLKGLKGRPDIKPNIKPSGMDKDTAPAKPAKNEKRPGRGKVAPRVKIEDEVVGVEVPPGSTFKGHEPFLVQDLVISAKATCYLRERWMTPDGRTILAPLPVGVEGHFGPGLRRFVLAQYHQGQSTMPRLLTLLRSVGVSISKRQLVRLLNENHEAFIAEAQDVLRAGLQTSSWVSVDDTGVRHAGKNGFCTQIGNEWFTQFRTRSSKSRLNFLDLLRAGHTDYVLNDAAYPYMREHDLAAASIALLAAGPLRRFADEAAWLAHLDQLGFNALKVTPNPVQIATEAALWGSVQAHEFLCDAVILSDDAGQFNVGRHALCWAKPGKVPAMRSIVGKQAEGHAERLVHKVDTFNDLHRAAQAQVRGLIWEFYADLKAYQVKPGKRRARALRTPELSGGEKQGPISHALAAEPDLLLCDEITSALDPIGGASVIALIEDLRDRVALGVMLVSHNLMTVSRIADEVNVLRHGVIVERGAPADVLQAPLHPYTKLLVRIGSQTGYWLGGASRSCSCPSGTRR